MCIRDRLQPPSPGSIVWFCLICSRRGGSTAAAVTLDTVADESTNKMADGATRSPARLCSRDGKVCYDGRLEFDFLSFVPCFPLFILPYPGMFIFAFLRLCSSHLLLLTSILYSYFIVRVPSCVICILAHLGILCLYSFSIFS